MSSCSINAGDTEPLRVQIIDALGQPRDLSDLDAVMLYMMTRAGVHVLGPKACDFSEGNGVVSYAWGFGETALPGTYELQFDLRRARTTGSNEASGDFPFSDRLDVVRGTFPFTGLMPLPAPQQLQFEIEGDVGGDIQFHIEGKDEWGDSVSEDVDGSSGDVLTGNYYSSITLATMTCADFFGESRTVGIQGIDDFSLGGQGRVLTAVRGRAPARGYLDLFIQAAVP